MRCVAFSVCQYVCLSYVQSTGQFKDIFENNCSCYFETAISLKMNTVSFYKVIWQNKDDSIHN